jgi:gamma-glutamylcyclotransferase (GGCT)/AIG2-like uncharacterized protein YtfP
LFTYGSLMFEPVWLAVARQACKCVPARLVDYAAYRIAHEPYPGLVPAPGHVTRGQLYQSVSDAALVYLDAFEGAFYERIEIFVRLDDHSKVVAATYRVAPAFRPQVLAELWDPETFQREHLAAFLAQIERV